MTDADPSPAMIAERRTRRISLVALLFILPLTVAAESWRSYADHRRDEESGVIDIPAGGKGIYAGATWMLVEMQAVGTREAGPMIPAGRALVRARFDVEATRPIGADWEQCRAALVGEDGRRWLGLDDIPYPLRRLLARGSDLRDCRRNALDPPKPGTRISIDEVFFIPEAELPRVRAVISTAAGRPEYLRFTLPGRIVS